MLITSSVSGTKIAQFIWIGLSQSCSGWCDTVDVPLKRSSTWLHSTCLQSAIKEGNKLCCLFVWSYTSHSTLELKQWNAITYCPENENSLYVLVMHVLMVWAFEWLGSFWHLLLELIWAPIWKRKTNSQFITVLQNYAQLTAEYDGKVKDLKLWLTIWVRLVSADKLVIWLCSVLVRY